jgi:hypothetical protein
MEITTYSVQGFYCAAYGARLSYGGTSLAKLDSDLATDTLGYADCKLLSKLIQRGDSHAKAMRMVDVKFRIVANTKFFMQLDQYKVDTVSLSTSTMHTIMKRELTQQDFSTPVEKRYLEYLYFLQRGKEFKLLIDSLPMSYLYTRVMKLNYQTLRNIYLDRKGHRYDYWEEFLSWVDTLPHSRELISV